MLDRPKPRTNAAYACDENRQLIYMFGGYDETNELNDFWVFDLNTHEWSPMETLNGPSPRSGAKMVFDSVGNQIFIIGRKATRGQENLKVIRFLNFNIVWKASVEPAKDLEIYNPRGIPKKGSKGYIKDLYWIGSIRFWWKSFKGGGDKQPWKFLIWLNIENPKLCEEN